MKVLVIDDNIRNLRLLSDMVAAMGHEVEAAQGAHEGLAMARATPVDLILMDIQMPELSGTEVMHILKNEPDWQPTPIVAITAHAMQSDERDLLAAGFDAYISKPVGFAELLELIQKL